MKKSQLKKSSDFDSPLSTKPDFAATVTGLTQKGRVLSNFSRNTGIHKQNLSRPSTVSIQKPRSKSNDLKVNQMYSGNIEEYALGQTLGFGAYAVVKLASHLKTQEKFAIKTYEKVKLLDPQRKKNLISEIKVLKSLSHPHVIKLKEAIDSPKQIHLVMEYAGGCSLWSFLKKRSNRALPESLAKKYFSQLVSGMSYCHSQGVLHRDLKLENILLDSSNSVKIIDFGFATFVRSPEYSKLFCGTPSYMAPEIVGKRENPGAPADVWALGVLLFVMLTGSYPFKSNSDRELYKVILKGKVEIPIGLSQTAKALLRKILQVESRKRPTCAQILKDPWFGELKARECNFGDVSFESTAVKGNAFNCEEKENFRMV
jgi:MAP/microtubule affinity-regulating kinase